MKQYFSITCLFLITGLLHLSCSSSPSKLLDASIPVDQHAMLLAFGLGWDLTYFSDDVSVIGFNEREGNFIREGNVGIIPPGKHKISTWVFGSTMRNANGDRPTARAEIEYDFLPGERYVLFGKITDRSRPIKAELLIYTVEEFEPIFYQLRPTRFRLQTITGEEWDSRGVSFEQRVIARFDKLADELNK